MCLNGIYDCLYSSELFLNARQKAVMTSRVQSFGKHANACREYAKLESRLYFQVTWKVHQPMHLPYQAELINPRAVQCYNSESLQGRAQRIWKASCKSPASPTRQQEAAIYKYLVSLIIALHL